MTAEAVPPPTDSSGGVLALTVRPGSAEGARLERVPEPAPEEGGVLVETLAVGVCGTDRDIARGAFGAAPPGQERLVLGHEVLGRVREAPDGAGLEPGQLVTALVRHPGGCERCAAGEWDMCRDGAFTESGILGRHGFARERFRSDPGHVVPLPEGLARTGTLVETASVVAKAWAQVDRVSARSEAPVRRAAVVGAGPVGLLAALLAVQRGLEVHVLDLPSRPRKAELVAALGATFHTGPVAGVADLEPDVVVECTGAAAVVGALLAEPAVNSTTCLVGMAHTTQGPALDAGVLNDHLVHRNAVVLGTMNAHRRHFDAALEALDQADPAWLEAMITRRVPLAEGPEALAPVADDIKTVIDVQG